MSVENRLQMFDPANQHWPLASAITKTVLSLAEYKSAKCIGIYLSMPDGELRTRQLLHDAFRQGKQVFVPYIRKISSLDEGKPSSVMDMVSLESQEDYEALTPDAWGIPSISGSSIGVRRHILGEASDTANSFHDDVSVSSSDCLPLKQKGTEILDMIVMPGVAFDTSLGRLGHGKGFYDYFLERYHRSNPASMPFLGA